MSVNNNYLYLQATKANPERFVTRHHPVVAKIRAAAYAALGLLALAFSSINSFYTVVGMLALGYSGWTVYSHLLKKDPLVEKFYEIAGGKERYEALPAHQVDHNIFSTVEKLSWESLEHPISRITTADGRQVLVVKAVVKDRDNIEMKTITAYVEGLSFADFPPIARNTHTWSDTVFEALAGRDQNNLSRLIDYWFASEAQRGSIRSLKSSIDISLVPS